MFTVQIKDKAILCVKITFFLFFRRRHQIFFLDSLQLKNTNSFTILFNEVDPPAAEYSERTKVIIRPGPTPVFPFCSTYKF